MDGYEAPQPAGSAPDLKLPAPSPPGVAQVPWEGLGCPTPGAQGHLCSLSISEDTAFSHPCSLGGCTMPERVREGSRWGFRPVGGPVHWPPGIGPGTALPRPLVGDVLPRREAAPPSPPGPTHLARPWGWMCFLLGLISGLFWSVPWWRCGLAQAPASPLAVPGRGSAQAVPASGWALPGAPGHL